MQWRHLLTLHSIAQIQKGESRFRVAGPRERNTIAFSQIQYLRKEGTDKSAHISAWLRQGEKVPWTTPEVMFWAATGNVGEAPVLERPWTNRRRVSVVR